MSNKNDKNSKNTNKKKTPLQMGAAISNWLSLGLMIIGLIMVVLKLFGIIPVTWFVAWLPFLIGVIVGFAWFIFAMIMINIFKKR